MICNGLRGHSAQLSVLSLDPGLENRIQLKEKCEARDLASIIKADQKTFVICDVEGYEEELMNPEVVPGLVKADILLELHDFLVPGISDVIRARFEGTHVIEIFSEKARTLEQYPYNSVVTKFLPSKYKLWAVGEHRTAQMHWFWMKARG